MSKNRIALNEEETADFLVLARYCANKANAYCEETYGLGDRDEKAQQLLALIDRIDAMSVPL